MSKTNPIRPADDEARALARQLLGAARFCAIGVIDPQSGAPQVSRVALGTDPEGSPLTLISDLSAHTQALRTNPLCSLLIGEPGPKGDPLTHPRMTLTARAEFVEHGDAVYADLSAHYLTTHPKSQLYIGFTDFCFLRFHVSAVALNGGFGKAYHLSPTDLKPAP